MAEATAHSLRNIPSISASGPIGGDFASGPIEGRDPQISQSLSQSFEQNPSGSLERSQSGPMTSSLSGSISGSLSESLSGSFAARSSFEPTGDEEIVVETVSQFDTPIMEYASRLSQAIGARPAGTEEEQQASFYLEEVFKDEIGLRTEVEEFKCNTNYELPRTICCVAAVVLAMLGIFLPLTLVPAIVLTLILAALYVLECFGISPLSRFGNKGISQNIVARFVPGSRPDATGAGIGASGAGVSGSIEALTEAAASATSSRSSRRKRKIVLVAHYDTGKVRAELRDPITGTLNIIHWVELGAMVLIPILLLIRLAIPGSEAGIIVLNVITIIAAVAALLPVISYVMHQTALYSTGANCNAAGVAAMLDVARRIQEAPEIDFTEDVVMNGEAALRESGLIPEGAVLTYEGSTEAAGQSAVPAHEAAGVDAIFGGTPAQGTGVGAGVDAIFGNIPSTMDAISTSAALTGEIDLTSDGEPLGGMGAEASGLASAVAPVGQEEVDQSQILEISAPEEDDGVPDWFKRGRQKAMEHKPEADHGPTIVQRSRFADALEAAEAELNAISEQEAAEAAAKSAVAEQRLQQMRESIMGQAAGAQSSLRNAVQNAANGGSVRGANGESATGYIAPKPEDVQVEVVEAEDVEGAEVSGQEAVPTTGQDDVAALMQQAKSHPENAAGQTVGSAAEAAAAGIPHVQVTQTGAGAGVGGYLSNTMDAPDYASLTKQEQAQSTQPEQSAKQPTQAELEAAERQAKKDAITDRTIGFIPVAVGKEELAASAAAATAAATEKAPATGSAASAQAHADDAKKPRGRREIALPSLTGSIEGVAAKLQEAPLSDDASEKSEEEIKAKRLARQEALASTIPSTDEGASGQKDVAAPGQEDVATLNRAAKRHPENTTGQRHTGTASGRPSTSTSRSASSSRTKRAAAASSKRTPQPIVPEANTSAAFNPVSEEIIANAKSADVFIEDVDDSAYAARLTPSGAPVGAGYVDMPKSRVFGRFRRNKKSRKEDVSLKDSLGLDDSFDAREVGKARGSWQSFREEGISDLDNFDNLDDEWNGGAFSKLRESALPSRRSGRNDRYAEDDFYGADAGDGAYYDEYGEVEAYDDYDAYSGQEDVAAPNRAAKRHPENAAGRRHADDVSSQNGRFGNLLNRAHRSKEDESGSAPQTRKRSLNPFDGVPLDFVGNQMEEREAIQQLRSGALNTEVWFVALGAELADNAGMKAFMNEHNDDLRGSVVINLNGFGAGTLSLIDEEGMYRPVKTSSRMKRYVTKAASALGMHIPTAKMLWRDSAAYVAARRGYQVLDLAGILNGKTAFSAQANDVFENLSEETLLQNSDFLLELVRTI